MQGVFFASDLKTGTLVACLPGTLCYRVSAGTGWLDATILGLGEAASWIPIFCLSVVTHTTV